MWVSEMGIPQSVTIDISNLKNRPQFYQTFAFQCWHSYSSNPAKIQLLVSQDGVNFICWLLLMPRNFAGFQYFAIDPISSKKYKFVQIVVRQTYGASKTYMNSVCLFQERVGSKSDGLPIERQDGHHQNQIMEVKDQYEEDQQPSQETGNFEPTNSPQIKGQNFRRKHQSKSRSPDNYNTVTSSGAFTARNRPPLFSQRGRAIEREIRSGNNCNSRQSTSIRSQLSDQIESMQKQLQNLARKKKVNVQKLRTSHDNVQNPLEGTLGTFSSAQLGKTSGDQNIPRIQQSNAHQHFISSITPETARRSRSQNVEFAFSSPKNQVIFLRKQMKNMLEAMSALQSSFNLVCEKVQNLQDDNDRLKQQVAFFGSTRGTTQPESERINLQQCTLPLHPQNSNRQVNIRSTLTESTARNLGASNSAFSKPMSRGQLSSERRHLDHPSSFNNLLQQQSSVQQQQQPISQKTYNKYAESPLLTNPSPTLNFNHESVVEMKNQIADECITFCRDKINEFMMNQQHQNQVQSQATPDRRMLSQVNVEKIVERKVEDFLGNIKDKLIDNYLQGSVRQRIYTIENKMQENFQNLRERFEKKTNLGQNQHAFPYQNASPAYSFSDSKNKIQMRHIANYQPARDVGGMPIQSEFIQSRVLTQNRPVRENPATKFEASKSQSSIGSELVEQTQNINDLFNKLNMKLNEKASKLNQLKEQNEKEKYYITPNKSNYNLLTNQR